MERMKYWLAGLLSILCLAGSTAQVLAPYEQLQDNSQKPLQADSQNQIPADSLVRASVVVEGLFFDKSVSPKSITPGNSTLAVMRDPDGNMVLAVFLPKGFQLEESVKSKAIPANRVMYSETLLSDYEGHRPATVADYEGLGVEVGKPFIKFNYKDTENNVWNNDVLKGKVYVINAWQKECKPCRQEMPVLSEWKERYPEVVFLSASRHDKEEIIPIAEQHNFTWNHLQKATDIIALVNKEGFPLTVVVDKEGIVRYAKVGASKDNQAEALSVIEELAR